MLPKKKSARKGRFISLLLRVTCVLPVLLEIHALHLSRAMLGCLCDVRPVTRVSFRLVCVNSILLKYAKYLIRGVFIFVKLTQFICLCHSS